MMRMLIHNDNAINEQYLEAVEVRIIVITILIMIVIFLDDNNEHSYYNDNDNAINEQYIEAVNVR